MPNVDLLLARVRRTFGDASPEQAVERVRAIIGTERLPENAEGGLAREALRALKNGEDPTPKQLAALEMMMRMMRPAPKIVAGRPEDFAEEDFLKLFPAWEKFQEAVRPFVRSIGRIDRTDGIPLGTGFLVNETTLVTNRHVLDGASNGTRRLERGQAIVSFRREFQTPDETPVDIVGVKAFHETLDIAVLQVESRTFSADRQPLSVSTGPKVGDNVVAIGFPFNDPQRNPLFIGTVFGNRFGVKRAAPGDVVAASTDGLRWSHDCSTLGGNSGSPLLSMDTAQVVGLHFGGTFLWRNEAVDASALGVFLNAHP